MLGGLGDVQLAPALLRLSPGSKLLELCPKFAFWVPQEGRRRKSQRIFFSILSTVINLLSSYSINKQLAPALLYSPPASKLLELCPKFAPWVVKEGRRRLPASSRSTPFTSCFKTTCAIPETVTLGGLEGEDEVRC
ncbi:hypothetical protein BDR03DRAFT_1013878 [Suillus americanus]|nr:hypothetical protein BDR03DRAFT_1013878 [Suillus americanus]